MNTPLDPDILQQVRVILRRDLKLAVDEPLPEEMPFVGSSVDLDSLDMLLLLTSIERQFGVRIPNSAVGKEVFESVATLSRYVQTHRSPAGAKPAAAPPAPVDWLIRLPHGPEFRFVSRVLEVRAGEFAQGVWSPNGKEPFFAGHFPGSPLVPGVLIAEALAQIAGLAGPAGGGREGKLAHVDVRFEQAVVPPVEIELTAKLVRVLGPLQLFEVVAQVGTTIIARGSISLNRGGPA